MALRYVQEAAFKQSVSIPDSATDSDVSMALHAAETAVERVTHRRFLTDQSPSTRVYTACDPCKVYVDDFTDVDTVTVDGVTITGYIPGPANAVADGQPYIYLVSELRTPIFASSRENGVSVTGTFEWPELPGDVPQMVTILASRMLKRTREAPFGIVTGGSIEGIAMHLAQTDPEVSTLIDPLIRYG